MNSDPVPRCPVAAICLLFCLCLPASVGAVWMAETISPSDPEPIAADISGPYVVYSVAYGEAINLSTPRGLLLFNADTGRTSSLAVSSGEMTLTGGQVSGDAVVWFEEPQAFSDDSSVPAVNNSVRLYSIAAETTTTIRESPSAEWPKTDGGRVIWTETDEDTYLSSLLLYDVASQTTEVLPVHPIDGSAVVLDGDTIAFRDAGTYALTLYDIPSGEQTAVMVPVRTNITRTMVDAYAMGGDVLLYTTRTIHDGQNGRSITNTLTWYTISDKTNVTLSPVTGNAVKTLSGDEQTASYDSLFTDGETLGWVRETGISESVVITVSTGTGNVSRKKIDGDVAFPSLDGMRAVWVQSKMLAEAHLVLATWHGPGSDGNTPVPETTRVPGFGVLGAVSALAALAATGRKR